MSNKNLTRDILSDNNKMFDNNRKNPTTQSSVSKLSIFHHSGIIRTIVTLNQQYAEKKQHTLSTALKETVYSMCLDVIMWYTVSYYCICLDC